MKRNKKAKKWQLYTAIGIASVIVIGACLLYTSPSPRDGATSRMPSSA